MSRLGWLSAFLLTAVGLYFSRGLLDVVSGSSGAVRVAMLPAWWELAALALALGGVAVAAARGDRDSDVVVPLCALALLAAPYMPWLPDRVPLLQALAGPARDLLWVVVFWVVGGRAFAGLRWSTLAARAPVAIFVASTAIFGATAWRLTTTVQYPSGDEPHYLVITQSLLTDRDFKIENNHQRGDYRAYFPLPLRPDYLTRGRDGQIYSIHPVGLAILAMPAFAIAGYRGVVAMLVVMAGLAATLMWRWARDVGGSAAAATFAWAAAALTGPFLFNSFTVYPEIPGALAVLVALAWRPESTANATLVARGIALGVLPWLSTKYAVMAAAVALAVAMRARWKMRALVAVGTPMVILVAAWFGFFYWIWGTFSPSAPYGASEPMTLTFLAHGGPGLFFDQEYGVVAYAPVLAIAFIGLLQMWQAGGDMRLRAAEVALTIGALVATVGAFHIWWGGSAAPGRPVASAVLLLGVPIASFFASTKSRPAARATCQAMLAFSLALAVALATKQQGSLLHNDRDGTASLLEWMAPTWPLTAVFPSYIAQTLGGAVLRTVGWLIVGGLAAWIAARASPRRFGAAALAFVTLGIVSGVAYASATRPATAPATIDPTARARVPLLDEFDAARRPIVVVYDPWRRTSADDVLARAALIARPGQRTLRQPVDLLWNARFALPAGEYRVDLKRPNDDGGSNGDVSVGLQIGRVGPPVERWHIAERDWSQRVLLPLDASLVGLRPLTTRGLGEGELRITPIRVADASRRTARPPILSAVRYGPLTAFFHDDATTGEAAGFWTHGRGLTQVTLAAAAAPAFDAEVKCGPIGNHVTLRMGRSWSLETTIGAGESRRVQIPMSREGGLDLRLAPLDITVRDGFVPAELDAASSDRRVLGCWIGMDRLMAYSQ